MINREAWAATFPPSLEVLELDWEDKQYWLEALRDQTLWKPNNLGQFSVMAPSKPVWIEKGLSGEDEDQSINQFVLKDPI